VRCDREVAMTGPLALDAAAAADDDDDDSTGAVRNLSGCFESHTPTPTAPQIVLGGLENGTCTTPAIARPFRLMPISTVTADTMPNVNSFVPSSGSA